MMKMKAQQYTGRENAYLNIENDTKKRGQDCWKYWCAINKFYTFRAKKIVGKEPARPKNFQ